MMIVLPKIGLVVVWDAPAAPEPLDVPLAGTLTVPLAETLDVPFAGTLAVLVAAVVTGDPVNKTMLLLLGIGPTNADTDAPQRCKGAHYAPALQWGLGWSCLQKNQMANHIRTYPCREDRLRTNWPQPVQQRGHNCGVDWWRIFLKCSRVEAWYRGGQIGMRLEGGWKVSVVLGEKNRLTVTRERRAFYGYFMFLLLFYLMASVIQDRLCQLNKLNSIDDECRALPLNSNKTLCRDSAQKYSPVAANVDFKMFQVVGGN
ncbi:hypothetical protein BDQ17DRAFT_1326365 [Cyathus striatus]|nr:hypothetical protein BDQ17DRAFT_1326365 [Cyathus striatus]